MQQPRPHTARARAHPQLLRVLAAALALAASWPAVAVPGPPIGCGGDFGQGGCAPYSRIFFATNGGNGGLYEYQPVPLDPVYSDSLGNLRGQVDLPTGELKGFGRTNNDGNPSTNNGLIVSVGASDVFTLRGPPSFVNMVQFAIVMTADGVGASDLVGYGGQAMLQFGGPSLGLAPGSVPYARRLYQAGVDGLPVFSDFPVHLFAAANVVMAVDVPFQLDTMLRADLWEASYMDLSHTAHLRFVLPPGVSVGSMGGFAQAAVVPEPAAAWLLLAGLAGMAGLARRRH